MSPSADDELLRRIFRSTIRPRCGGNMELKKSIEKQPVCSPRYVSILLVAVLIAIVLPVFGFAQSEQPFTLNLGAGVTPLTGGVSHRLDNGWQVDVGAGL